MTIQIHGLTLVIGDSVGAIFIDQEFFKWLKNVLEDLKVDMQGVGSGGHHCFSPVAKQLLESFQTVKHKFGGEEMEAAHILLPEDAKILDNDLARQLIVDDELKIPE
jgi:hypothetical protein